MSPELLERLLLAAAGPLIGSCLGLLTLRLPAGAPVGAERSACGSCGRKLTPVDLIPLLSWAALGARCRSCRAPIPLRYPLIEAGCAGIGLWAALIFDGSLAAAAAGFGWMLLLIAIIDAEHFWLPHRLTAPLAVAGVLAAWLLAPQTLLDRGIGAAAGWSVLVLVAVGYRRLRGREGLGGGDPMMLAAIGAWTGWQGLPSVLLIACAAGLLAALVLRRLEADARLPFGTLMAIGGWLVLLYGPIGA